MEIVSPFKKNFNENSLILYYNLYLLLEKKSFKDRIAWVDTNLEDIVNFDNGVLVLFH